MKKTGKLLLVILISTLLFCGCENKSARLEREAKEAQKRSEEANKNIERQRRN